MQLASIPVLSQPPLAAMPQLREKPRLGFSSKNPALHQVHEVCNSTTALGLQAALHLERIRSRYTGKERDSESGNDYFGARYYASSTGRWMSPDPINLTNARLLNPANTLNKYAYGGNNPLKYVDKDGKDITVFYEPPHSILETGHVFVGVVNQDTGKSAFFSYGPAGDGKVWQSVPATSSFPMNFQGSASLTIQTNPEDAQKLIDAVNKIESGQLPDFNLFSSNCTTELEDVLKDYGLDFGDNDPSQYWAHLYSSYSQDAMDNPFRAFGPVPNQSGKDYGNPRYGMNTNDLLFRLWWYSAFQNQPDNSSVTTTETVTLPDGTKQSY